MAGIVVLLLMASMLNEAEANISSPNVTCTIINLEYIDCAWIAQGIQEVNYTFHRIESSTYQECPSYLLQNGLTVGCRLPYTIGQKFRKLHTRLSRENGSSEGEQVIDLKHLVKLNPPHSLLLEMKEGESYPELWLRWNVSCPHTCLESQVQYRERSSHRWQVTHPIEGYTFIPPFFSPYDTYEFQVRVRIPDSCSQSKYWSDWSTPVVWVSKPRSKSAGFHPWRLDSAVLRLALAAAAVALVG